MECSFYNRISHKNGDVENGMYRLIIPNKEVREVFLLQIRDWFDQVVANDHASTEKSTGVFLKERQMTSSGNLQCFLAKQSAF